MTGAGEMLAAEIGRAGPIPFSRFMEVALYHPSHGYYRRRPARDPFGAHGDFFTAEQLQPVFGILMALRLRQLRRELGEPADFTVVEIGAGRGEMAPYFSAWHYLPLEIGSGELPAELEGVVFSNEFFDALPVDVAVYTGGAFRQRLVGEAAGRFHWITGPPVSSDAEDYLRRYFSAPEEDRIYEIHLAALDWMERIAAALRRGFVLTVDYGYTRPESVRFPAGTLMSYRRHTALDTVLEEPGERDITAHVNFTALADFAAARGLAPVRLETLAQTLLAAGEPDQFASALTGDDTLRRRMQLKTLLFGMGETFRVLLQRKDLGRER